MLLSAPTGSALFLFRKFQALTQPINVRPSPVIVAGLFGVIYYLMAAAGMNPFIRGLKSMWEGDSWMEEHKEPKSSLKT